MRFVLCVRLGVDLHVRLTEEGGRTHPAPTSKETQKRGGQDGKTTRRKRGMDGWMDGGGEEGRDGGRRDVNRGKGGGTNTQ